MILPAAMRVLERGWLSSNSILFCGPGETALVDSGYVAHAELTVALVGQALEGRPLALLLNTHLHSDHCGGNAALQAHYAAWHGERWTEGGARLRTLVPAAQAHMVNEWRQAELSFAATGQRCARFACDGVLTPGDTQELGGLVWQVLAAPGHDPHALMLFEAGHGILISADALWEDGFGVIFPELDGGAGFAEARATLELIATLDVRLVIPGHGAPFSDVSAALRRATSRLDYLQADPANNARYAVKVLLKFLLLERRRIALDEVAPLLASIPLAVAADRNFLRLGSEALATWCIAQLVRAHAAVVQGDSLVNRD